MCSLHLVFFLQCVLIFSFPFLSPKPVHLLLLAVSSSVLPSLSCAGLPALFRPIRFSSRLWKCRLATSHTLFPWFQGAAFKSHGYEGRQSVKIKTTKKSSTPYLFVFSFSAEANVALTWVMAMPHSLFLGWVGSGDLKHLIVRPRKPSFFLDSFEVGSL